MHRQIIYILAIIPSLIITGCSSAPIDEEVNLYTARKEHLIRPLVDIFEKDKKDYRRKHIYLSKKGEEGFHHIAMLVPDADVKTEAKRFASAGYPVASELWSHAANTLML